MILTDEQKESIEPRHIPDEAFVKSARRFYNDPGRIEVDIGANLSRNEGYDPGGAYVKAWIWIGKEDALSEAETLNIELSDL